MADNFRRHVPGCATCILAVIISHYPRDPKICYPEISLFIKNEILWLQVTMDDAVLVKILQTYYNVCNIEFGLCLVEFAFSSDVVSQISTI